MDIATVPPRITGNAALPAHAVSDFPFATLKAHQCISFDEIQHLDRRRNTANHDPMQIARAFPWKLLAREKGSYWPSVRIMRRTNGTYEWKRKIK